MGKLGVSWKYNLNYRVFDSYWILKLVCVEWNQLNNQFSFIWFPKYTLVVEFLANYENLVAMYGVVWYIATVMHRKLVYLYKTGNW